MTDFTESLTQLVQRGDVDRAPRWKWRRIAKLSHALKGIKVSSREFSNNGREEERVGIANCKLQIANLPLFASRLLREFAIAICNLQFAILLRSLHGLLGFPTHSGGGSSSRRGYYFNLLNLIVFDNSLPVLVQPAPGG